MAEIPFQSLSARDRRDALRAAQEASCRRAFLLEKDVWIVQTLRILFGAPFGPHLVFKGGTSLAKSRRLDQPGRLRPRRHSRSARYARDAASSISGTTLSGSTRTIR